ncbi:hypothetical protein NC653_037363 [Populus alba x Populus x berolinensis]|uniref:Uncharacterized protein n=1 Tax=Populus alba x Populus x berolinensis TaxID=444605 RepID=A0AAD6LGS8_9ROSI|nr:hypothetical protein NC653_037363 [Populus alba x Populus x berolinensis]
MLRILPLSLRICHLAQLQNYHPKTNVIISERLIAYCVEVLYKAGEIQVYLFFSLLIYIDFVDVGNYVCWLLSLPLTSLNSCLNHGNES